MGLLMAGGQGERLWPLSTEKLPKQYLSLWGGKSLLRHSLERLRGVVEDRHLYIMTVEAQRELALRDWDQVLLEPHGRNTAPALYLALLELRSFGCRPFDVLGFFPADHYIGSVDSFRQTAREGYALAGRKEGYLVLMGIPPRSAHTSYGYLKKGSGNEVTSFTEKPREEVAQGFFDSGDYLWNGGVFWGTWEAFYRHFEDYLPAYLKVEQPSVHYENLEALSFDRVILENSKKLLFVEGMFEWSDIGEWGSLVSILRKVGEEGGQGS